MNLLALLLTVAIVTSSVLLLTGRSRSGRGLAASGTAVHDDHEAAFLVGGPGRVMDTALTALHTDGRIVIGGPGVVSVVRAEPHDPVERAVLQELASAPNGALHILRFSVMHHPAVQEIGDGLAARDLLARPEEVRTRRRWAGIQGLVCLALFPVSMVATFVQYAVIDGFGEIPLPFIVKMLPAILFGGVCALVAGSRARARITKAGQAAARAYRTARAGSAGTPAQLVAAFGLRSLADTALRDQLTAAARYGAPGSPVRSGSSSARHHGAADSSVAGVAMVPVVWCAGTGPGGGCGSGSGSSCGAGSGSSCGGGGSSSCGGSGSGGSSCGGSSSSCGSSSSSCGGSSSSCGGGSS
ncbi:TIGR04222 domain-containing membrane protein [Streptomyces sp. NPDC060198]|uniref:TIGR04222 domain-containing membrane protein n=1 Tax=Streptomyces sp. NPDC060198 TaxID=3347070 RepID=UPI00365B0071